jgi:hypothetical protein
MEKIPRIGDPGEIHGETEWDTRMILDERTRSLGRSSSNIRRLEEDTKDPGEIQWDPRWVRRDLWKIVRDLGEIQGIRYSEIRDNFKEIQRDTTRRNGQNLTNKKSKEVTRNTRWSRGDTERFVEDTERSVWATGESGEIQKDLWKTQRDLDEMGRISRIENRRKLPET